MSHLEKEGGFIKNNNNNHTSKNSTSKKTKAVKVKHRFTIKHLKYLCLYKMTIDRNQHNGSGDKGACYQNLPHL